jgi:hypothetical protein
MRTNNKTKLLMAALTATLVASCMKSKGGFSALSQTENPIAEAQNYTVGTPASEAALSKITYAKGDGTALTQDEVAMMLEGNADLAKNVGELQAVTRKVKTQENNIELYAGAELVMALGMSSGNLSVLSSRNDFEAKSIATTAMSGLTFTFDNCVEPEPSPTPSASPSPTASASPSPSPTTTETAAVAGEQSGTCDTLVVTLDFGTVAGGNGNGQKQTQTQEEIPTPMPTVTATPTPMPTEQPKEEPKEEPKEPVQTPVKSPGQKQDQQEQQDQNQTPAPSPTPSSTATPTPTPSPEPTQT